MSSFFQTEPLYQQFYTNQHIKPEDALSITEDMYECVEHPDSLEMTPGMNVQASFRLSQEPVFSARSISIFFLIPPGTFTGTIGGSLQPERH